MASTPTLHRRSVQDGVIVDQFDEGAQPSREIAFAPPDSEVLIEFTFSDDDLETPKELGPLPAQLIDSYVRLAVLRATYELLESGRWFAEIPLLQDVWADGDSEAEAKDNLREVTLAWVLMKIEDRDQDLPVIGTIDLNGL